MKRRPNNAEFYGGAYEKGDPFPSYWPWRAKNYFETADGLRDLLSWTINPTKGALAASEAWKEHRYAKLPMLTLWQALRCWWTGKYPDHTPGSREFRGVQSPVLKRSKLWL